MRATDVTRRAAVALAAWLLAAAGCGGDSGEPTARPPGSAFVAPPADAAVASLAELTWNEVTLDALLERFDVDGDRDLDAADATALAGCVAAHADLDGLHCDLVPDGVVDAQDAYAFSIVAGEARPRSASAIARTASALRANAAGDFTPDLSPGAFDWNHDGVADARDLERLSEALEGDLTPLDLDGDGLVSFSDARSLAGAVARAKLRGGTPPAVDLDQSGASDEVDVALLTSLALYTSEVSFGLFDVNQDARVDLSDFCDVGEPGEAESFFASLMPAAAAHAAYAAAPPRFAVCRADGRPLARNVGHPNTPHLAKILPENLYLEPVDSIPADLSPIDPSKAAGRQLFIVSTTPTDRRLLSMSLPWDATLPGGDVARFQLSGPALPALSALVLPGAVAPLDPTQKALASKSTATSEVSTPLGGALVAADQASARELTENLAAAKALYEELIAGCPCSLAQADRDALVRYLLRAASGVDSTLGIARANLAAAEIELARLARLNVAAGNEAAGRQLLLAEDVVSMEVVKTLLLIAETGYDFTTKGPNEALKGAIDNLLGELASDHIIPAPQSMTAATVENVGGGLAVGTVTSVLRDMVSSHSEGLGLKEFTKEFVESVKKRVPQRNGDTLESVLKSVVKMIPVYFLEYQKLKAEEALIRSGQYAALYHGAVLRVGNLRHAIAVLEVAKSTLTDLRKRFLDKLQTDGCGVTVSTVDPCSFDLETALGAAAEQLAKDDAAAAAQLEQAYTGAGSEGIPSQCTGGAERARLDGARLAVAGAARALTEHVRAKGSADALAGLEGKLRQASESERAAGGDFAAACDLLAEVSLSPAQVSALASADEARQAARDAFVQAVKNAVAAYDACLASRGEPGSPCAFDAAQADASAWAAGATCLGCLPSVTMNCCGDGKVQSNERCDPAAAVDACGGAGPCDATCQCAGSSTTVPPSAQALAQRFGIALAVLQNGYLTLKLQQILHSSSSVPAKAVAGDHTTLTGLFAMRLTLAQAVIDALTCGPGPGPGDFTICPPGSNPLVAGDTIAVIATLGAPMPLNDSGNRYQYGFVFDANGVATDNYVPLPQYPNDFFSGTDLWFAANRTTAGVWSLSATSAAGGATTPVATRAHGFVSGNAMGLLVPASELTSATPPLRVTAFRDTGDYGMNPPYDWDGSVYPAVADGLMPFPP